MQARNRHVPKRGAYAFAAALIAAELALSVYDTIQPAVIVLPYMNVPVLFSLILLWPRLTGLLAAMAIAAGLLTSWVNDYFTSLNNALNVILLALLSVAAWIFSVLLEQRARERAQALARLSGAMQSELDARVFLAPVLDADGIVYDFTYRDVNPVACEALGRSREEMVGHRMRQLFPVINQRLFDGMVEVATTGVPVKLDEFRFFSVVFGSERCFDYRVVGAGEEISVGWRDVTESVELRDRIEAAERRARLLLENSTDVVWEADPEEDVTTWVSPSVERLTGWRPDDLIGVSFIEFIHPDDIERLTQARREISEGGASTVEIRVRKRDGDYRWMSVRAASMLDKQGRVIGLSGGWRDIDDEMKARSDLEAAEMRFRLLATETSDVIVQVGTDGRVQWASPSVTWSLGWDPRDVEDRVLRDFVHEDDAEMYDRLFSAINPEESRQATLRFRQPGAEYRWVDIACDSLNVAGGGWVLRIRDVEAHVRGIQELEARAATDPVTGLANRLAALQHLREITSERRGGQADAVLFIDLDRFKQINDSLGHHAGDEVLRAVGGRILGVTRRTDFVSRFGGDELLVILRGISNPTQAGLLAEQFREACAQPIDVGNGDTASTTVSIGVAITRPGEDMEHLLARVDAALYRAKEAGRDRVVTEAR